MFKTFYEDRSTIENKFHKVDEPFNGYRRRNYHGYPYDESTGLSDEEIKAGLVELAKENKDAPHSIAKAKAVAYVLDNTRIDVNASDYFVGFYSTARLIGPTTEDVWYEELFGEIIPDIKREMVLFDKAGVLQAEPDTGHSVPDWDSLISLGFSGIRERARKYRQMHIDDGTMTEKMDAHFKSIEIEYTAIINIIDRFYKLALTRTHEKAPKVAACLKQLRDGAPTNTYELLQFIYIYFIISDDFDIFQVRTLGHGIDSTILPFYKKDIEEGRYTREELRELFAYFMMQWAAIGNIMGQPMYLGGTNADGTTKVSDVTYDIIEVYDELGIIDPKIQLKVNTNTPEDIVYKMLDITRRSQASFVFCCEPGLKRAAMTYGMTEEEARNADIRGCWDMSAKGDEIATTSSTLNGIKALEYVFTNGFDKTVNEQIGLKTGLLSQIKSFEDFYALTLRQWGYLIEKAMSFVNEFEKYYDFICPSALYSGTIERSLKLGVDAYQGGVKFNNTTMLFCGYANLVDSLMGVKELVYDEKLITLEELGRALENNWEGYEALRTRILKSKHKFGNGDPMADAYASAIADYFAIKINNRPNSRGGVYKTSMHSAYYFVWYGKKTLATPDGRRAGEELGKNGSPAPGADRNGVTALVKSGISAHPYLFTDSYCLDVMLHPSATEGDDGLIAMKAVIDTYMMNGGTDIQFNVLDHKTLLDAQAHPDRYKNLSIRVTGWNALWNSLDKAEQDAYILRAENIEH